MQRLLGDWRKPLVSVLVEALSTIFDASTTWTFDYYFV